MHGKFELVFPGKASTHSVALPSFFPPLCAVFSCFHTTGCEANPFTTDGYGIFNAHPNLGACRTHEVGSGTNKSAQELTRRDRKTDFHSDPARGSNPGCAHLNSNSLITELRAPALPAVGKVFCISLQGIIQCKKKKFD